MSENFQNVQFDRLLSQFHCRCVAEGCLYGSMSRRRRSNRSDRLYSASVLSLTVCASASSATALGKFVRSEHQSRKLLRKPCAVRHSLLMRRYVINSASGQGLAGLTTGKHEATGLPSSSGFATFPFVGVFRNDDAVRSFGCDAPTCPNALHTRD